jgi:hypothetical protein
MVYLYRNFLIVDREDSMHFVRHMVRNNFRLWFDDDNLVWHVKSPADKIIVIYDREISAGDTIRTIRSEDEHKIDGNGRVGYIKIYCQNTNVKVSSMYFRNEEEGRRYLAMFKQYLLRTIRAVPENTRRDNTYTLYWKRSLCNDNVRRILRNLGLLDNIEKMTYTFQNNELIESAVTSAFTPFSSFSNSWNNW